MAKLQLTYLFDNEDELRAHIGGETRSADTAEALARLQEPAGTAADRSDVDGDGMAYDAAFHSDPPSFTDKGLWKSKRGAAKEAEAARAAWKARGAGVAAPALAAPVPAPIGMPALMAPTPAPAPVTIERVYEVTSAATARGVAVERITAVYPQIGLTDLAQFETNESMRAAYVAAVEAL